MNIGQHLLSLLIWLPIFGGFFVLIAKTDSGNGDGARWVSILIALLTFLL